MVALVARKVAVHLAGDVALEDAHDLEFGAAFDGAAFDVGTGARIVAHPGHHDPPQGVVGLTVAAAVQPVTDRLAGGGLDRGDAAEVGEGGFGGDPLGVVADGDEQQGGRVGTDTVQGEQVRARLL